MIFLVEAETLKLLILIVGVFIFKNGQSLCMIAFIKNVFLLLRCILSVFLSKSLNFVYVFISNRIWRILEEEKGRILRLSLGWLGWVLT